MTTMKDIGREAGVSESVVSAILSRSNGHIKASPKTTAKIHEIAARLKYRPNLNARKLAGKKSWIIGVVMDTCAPKIYHDRLSHMELYAARRGYRFMLGQAHNDTSKIKDYAQFFSGYGVDGMICMAHNYPGQSREIAEFFLFKNKTVFFEPPDGIADAYSVTIDIADNFFQAVKYLASRNRRRIGFFRINDLYSSHAMNLCQSGYCDGLMEVGIVFDPCLVQSVVSEEMKNPDAGMPKILALVESGVDSIICVNDYMAAVALKCLQRLKISVPGQVAVTGCDNLDIATLVSPELTTFEQHNDQVAIALVDLIVDQLEEKFIPPEKRQIVIKPTLIPRESA